MRELSEQLELFILLIMLWSICELILETYQKVSSRTLQNFGQIDNSREEILDSYTVKIYYIIINLSDSDTHYKVHM